MNAPFKRTYRLTVDRIEDGVAVLVAPVGEALPHGFSSLDVPTSLLPMLACEGAILAAEWTVIGLADKPQT